MAFEGQEGFEAAVRVSVIVPCHDSGPVLHEAIRSVLKQDPARDDVEVIVVDDRSSDSGTLAALDHWRGHERVRVVASERAPGPSGARNTGISLARGEWIAFLDSDDLWLPHALEARWDVIEREPQARFVSADFGYLHEDGRREMQGFYRTRPTPREALADAFETGEVLRLERPVSHFLRAVMVWTGVALVHAPLLAEVGGFDEDLLQSEDDLLWIRLARRTDLFFVPRVVALYRQWDGSLTTRKPSPARWNLKAYRKLLDDSEFREYRPLIRRRLSRFANQNAYYHRARGEWWLAAKEAAAAVGWDPGNARRWMALLGTLGQRS